MRETGGLELASTVTLVLQANRLTKCASHIKTNNPVSANSFGEYFSKAVNLVRGAYKTTIGTRESPGYYKLRIIS